MSLPALPVTADTRSIAERVNVLIRDYNTLSGVPAGCILPYAGAAAPAGWLLCHGQAVSRAAYADLFAALGTAWGAGDGSTTFNLPDLRGRVPAGKDDMGGTAANRLTGGGSGVNGATLGATGGAETHVLSAAQMPSHSHGINDAGHAHAFPQPLTSSFGGALYGSHDAGPGSLYAVSATNSATTGISIQNAGGGGAHNNTQPTVVLNYVIAT